jgi:hypothetical protein
MATTHRPRHHQATDTGRHRPLLDPPRFTQAPTHHGRPYQDFPLGPGAAPYRVKLEDLVSHLPDGLDKKMVFHICGDTGGVKNPGPQQLVASAMEANATDTTADGETAFFYRLGDVVYYNGETSEYYPQFYLPYEFYPLPIKGIPGYHDGDPLTTLDTPRRATTAKPCSCACTIRSFPLTRIISPAMKDLLDTAVKESGAYPDIVFGAQVHNYQRFTRTIDNQQFTYIVAGAGGYWHLHSMAKFKGAKVTAPFRQVDDPNVILENYVDDTHGFMRVEIEDDLITARYFAVPRTHDAPETPARVADLFQLQFKANKLVR